MSYEERTRKGQKVWQDAFNEAYAAEFDEIYERLFEEELNKQLKIYGEDVQEARTIAHTNILDDVKDCAQINAKDIADAVYADWRISGE